MGNSTVTVNSGIEQNHDFNSATKDSESKFLSRLYLVVLPRLVASSLTNTIKRTTPWKDTEDEIKKYHS